VGRRLRSNPKGVARVIDRIARYRVNYADERAEPRPTARHALWRNHRKCLVHLRSFAHAFKSFGSLAPPMLDASLRPLRSFAAILLLPFLRFLCLSRLFLLRSRKSLMGADTTDERELITTDTAYCGTGCTGLLYRSFERLSSSSSSSSLVRGGLIVS
jgi:hypothetical protein